MRRVIIITQVRTWPKATATTMLNQGKGCNQNQKIILKPIVKGVAPHRAFLTSRKYLPDLEHAIP